MSTISSVDDDNKNGANNDTAKRGKIQNDDKKHVMTLSSDVTTSETSTEALDLYENQSAKLSTVVDKLQDHEW